MPSDHPAGIGCSSVESDADACRRPVGSKLAVVGDEVVLRIFGGYAALQGMASELHVLLSRRAGRSREIRALRDPDLRLHDIDSCYFFGNRVLDLDARIDFNEMEFARVDVHQELDGAGVLIIRFAREPQRQFANLASLVFRQIRSRRAFDDFLVSPLNRAVPFVQVVYAAVRVAEDLNFDMPRSLDQFFQKACAVSECRFGFSSTLDDFLFQFVARSNDPHASTAAAPRSFQHERVSHLLRHFLGFAKIVRKHRGCGNDRHANGFRHDSGGGLVAQ